MVAQSHNSSAQVEARESRIQGLSLLGSNFVVSLA